MNPESDQPTTSRNGFTVIELMVVIAVAAILASVLLPALAGSRTQSALAVCLENQRQFARAWTMFGADHIDYMPSASTANATNENLFAWRITPGNLPSGPVTVPSGQTAAQFYDRFGFQRGALYPYINNANIIHCPADLRGLQTSGSGAPVWCSYSMVDNMNGAVAPSPPTLDYRVHKTIDVRHPSDRIVMNEESGARTDTRPAPNGSTVFELLGTFVPFKLGTGSGGDAPDPNANPKFSVMASGGTTGWFDSPAAFNNNGATFSFCDGHAEFHRWQDAATLQLAAKPTTLFPALSFSSATNDLTWLYSHIATPLWP
ncbi:MAG TPA: type II secretion system protein [Desulfuromonadaceae bacterium]|nr:type II secretion system protein [Desulfuromonadaceae bacterium]